MSTVDALLAQAVDHHRAGRLPQAADLYQRIIANNARHADAWHLLGLVAHQSGDQPTAIEYIKRAIEIDDRHASFYNSLGEAKRAAGELLEARDCYFRALRADPAFAPAHFNLGLVLQDTGDRAAAIGHLQEAIRLQPVVAQSHNVLGNALRGQGRLNEAVSAYEEALRLRPDFPEALNNLGVTLVNLRRVDEGLALLRRSLQLKPAAAETYGNLGYAYKSVGRTTEAVVALEEALRLRADFVEPRGALGELLHEAGQLDDAAQCFQEVLRLRPQAFEARYALGDIYQQQGLAEQAESCFRQVIAQQPDFAPAHDHLGALCLSQGRFEEGWNECEWRWRAKVEPRDFAQPVWDGSPLDGKTILVHPEQGFGDTLQFLRYVPLLEQRGARVVVEVQAPLLPLARSSLTAEVVAFGSTLPSFDVHAPLLSLPGLVGTTLETIPATVPYLTVDPELVASWRERLATIGGYRVGIAWQGNPEFTYDRARSIPLIEFSQLARVPGVELISLQRENGLDQLPPARRHFTIHELGEDVDTEHGAFVDTAAAMKNLDLVITSDTATAHLAGALSVPVWVALGFAPDWRWMHDRQDSPWYPSMRLYRQTQWQEWASVFERMVRQLELNMAGSAKRTQ
jgi:tetratricopeptide (TPR) repeat protein